MEGIEELENGALIGGGEIGDLLEALEEAGRLGERFSVLGWSPSSSSAETVRAWASAAKSAPGGCWLSVS